MHGALLFSLRHSFLTMATRQQQNEGQRSRRQSGRRQGRNARRRHSQQSRRSSGPETAADLGRQQSNEPNMSRYTQSQVQQRVRAEACCLGAETRTHVPLAEPDPVDELADALRRGGRIADKEKEEKATPSSHSSRDQVVITVHDSLSEDEDNFMEEIEDDFRCSVCLSLLREPVLTDCCGNHFCFVCIEQVRDSGHSCPLCKKSGFGFMCDKFIKRKIRELKVWCPYRPHGCTWSGELSRRSEHLDCKCSHSVQLCEHCGFQGRPGTMKEHRDTCSERSYTCQYCHVYRSTYEEVTSQHHPTCGSYPLKCPNGCGAHSIRRSRLKRHLSSECPLSEALSPYSAHSRSRSESETQINEEGASASSAAPVLETLFGALSDFVADAAQSHLKKEVERRHKEQECRQLSVLSPELNAVPRLLMRIASSCPDVLVSQTPVPELVQGTAVSAVCGGQLGKALGGGFGSMLAGALAGAAFGYFAGSDTVSAVDLLKRIVPSENKKLTKAAVEVAEEQGLTLEYSHITDSADLVCRPQRHRKSFLIAVLKKLDYHVESSS